MDCKPIKTLLDTLTLVKKNPENSQKKILKKRKTLPAFPEIITDKNETFLSEYRAKLENTVFVSPVQSLKPSTLSSKFSE